MRTWLFVPGHDSYKLHKALRSAADAVIVDWEDAVPPERKQEARALAGTILAQPPASPRCVIRMNGRHDPEFDADLAALALIPISAILLPKVGDPSDVIDLSHAIEPAIIPIIESALGVEAAFAIAKAHPRVERLAFGSLDFLADLGVQWAPHDPASQYARARIAIAGRAAGLEGPIDTVYPQLNDDDGLRRDAASARACGFVGKFLLHPAQIPIVREVFSPTPEELAQATAIIAAFQEARSRGESAVRLDGKFIDPPVVRWAQQMIALHDAEKTIDG
ncbi:MAG TPA: CoA ester lyase [Roseiflexaceae bacterium]|nr:CoA ester lyase [Roseiflexaceae bacterium]